MNRGGMQLRDPPAGIPPRGRHHPTTAAPAAGAAAGRRRRRKQLTRPNAGTDSGAGSQLREPAARAGTPSVSEPRACPRRYGSNRNRNGGSTSGDGSNGILERQLRQRRPGGWLWGSAGSVSLGLRLADVWRGVSQLWQPLSGTARPAGRRRRPYDYTQPINTVTRQSRQRAGRPTRRSPSFAPARPRSKQGNYDGRRPEGQPEALAKRRTTRPSTSSSPLPVRTGRYEQAATPLYAVLSVGPGWDWTTLIGIYPDVATYTVQLRKLEAYSESQPRSASGTVRPGLSIPTARPSHGGGPHPQGNRGDQAGRHALGPAPRQDQPAARTRRLRPLTPPRPASVPAARAQDRRNLDRSTVRRKPRSA